METHQQFWNQWSRTYQGFSETVEPYRDAQRRLAEGAVTALKNNLPQATLSIVDVGGGAGNLMRPLLDALRLQRSHLKGVSYTLTDGAQDMVGLAQVRLPALQQVFPEVSFHLHHANTLDDELYEKVRPSRGDLVISSWNIEYYPLEKRQEMVRRLTSLAHGQGVVAFSSSVRLPESLTIRELLMPLGQAQVLQSLLTGGPTQMRKVITSLKQIAEFGLAVNSHQFPDKPTLPELRQLATDAGLEQMAATYHLFGASGMIIARKDRAPTSALPRQPIARPLAGKAGYEGYSETTSFWSYFTYLVHNPPQI
ncbi:MAG: class I SAM-dependent methyltransferase [Caldilineaceae bacterium]